MLQSLFIYNYALIDELSLDFNSGLNVITGETGAGKSILIGALGLILGNRSDKSVVNRAINKKCIVEGVFNNLSSKINALLSDNDFDVEEELHIRREITITGKSRAFINDTPANLNQLKSLAALLIDVNSQYQTYEFKKPNYQLSVLDNLAETTETMEEYTILYQDFLSKQKLIEKLKQQDVEAKKEFDFVKFQFEELQTAELRIGEEEEIRNQLTILDNAELIKQSLHQSTILLSQNDENVLGYLEQVLALLQPIQGLHYEYEQLYQRLNSSLIELQDVASECEQLDENMEFEPHKLAELQERLDVILHLQQKHRMQSIEELIEYQDKLDNQLQEFDGLSDNIEKLQKELKQIKSKAETKAAVLSKKRLGSIPRISKKITTGLRGLGMKDAEFQVGVQIIDEIGPNGLDAIDFLFSSNKGHEVDSMLKVASGGELSRLVLTLKSMLSANRNLPTVIFDEIDTGVSGDIATKVGVVMQQMADNMQVIAITHLPQIAAKGDFHYRVFKKEVDNVVFSDIEILNSEQRKQQIALMLSGDADSKSALNMAEELLS